MTDPAHQPGQAAHPEQEAAPSPEMLELAAKVFNLAREGDTAALAAYVDAGVPVNLCNDKGDTLIMLAAYHGHPQTVVAPIPTAPTTVVRPRSRAPSSRANGR
jgi:hypothetical protein